MGGTPTLTQGLYGYVGLHQQACTCIAGRGVYLACVAGGIVWLHNTASYAG